MISVTGKRWLENKINKNLIEKLKQDYNFSGILSKLILTRNFDELEIDSIENNCNFTNVFSNNIDFKQSIQILSRTIHKRECIGILGDYDVDGSAATALLVKYFESINQPYFFYIPDREKDGYGASKELFEKLILKKPKLIIMVDCGSTSNSAIDYLNEKKIKSIIIDHHEINNPFPNADVIINPKKNNGYIEYNYLCATTLVYFFLELLSKKIKSNFEIKEYLIYALLATVCDVMPIRKLNRYLSITTINNFDINKNEPLKELYAQANKKKKINNEDLGFLIGPILNAGGRLGKSNYATELLSSNNSNLIKKRVLELINLNKKRREIETIIINEIDFNKIENENKDIIIYYNSNLNEGLIGIIAARLKEYFNKPSIVITKSNNILKGSARSIYNYNIGLAIKNALDKDIIIKGGGHNMAAGFTLNESKLKIFELFISKDYSKKLNLKKKNCVTYDAEISFIALNKLFWNDLKKLEPFGEANPVPTFLIRNLKAVKTIIFKKKHISLVLKSKTGLTIKAISFNSVKGKIGEYLLGYKKNFDVIGQINENIWNNKKVLQLTILDLII
jgi:single-stranded-DNA-specific exonuclease